MRTTRKKARKPKLPRAPLPKQTESVHEDKTKRPFRKEKHKKRWEEEASRPAGARQGSASAGSAESSFVAG
jgi:hypothetical protein